MIATFFSTSSNDTVEATFVTSSQKENAVDDHCHFRNGERQKLEEYFRAHASIFWYGLCLQFQKLKKAIRSLFRLIAYRKTHTILWRQHMNSVNFSLKFHCSKFVILSVAQGHQFGHHISALEESTATYRGLNLLIYINMGADSMVLRITLVDTNANFD